MHLRCLGVMQLVVLLHLHFRIQIVQSVESSLYLKVIHR
jgi:hypothetical protein